MTALGLGIATALLWGTSALTSARASRADGPMTVLVWYFGMGALVAVPVAFLSGTPSAPGSDWAWATGAGVAYTVGALLWLVAVESGKVSIVTPIVATDGAIAAVVSVLRGEELSAAIAVGLVVIVTGIVLVSAREGVHISGSRSARIVIVAVLAAVAFGLTFVAGAEPGALSPLWVVAASRLVALPLAAPLALARGRLRPSRAALPWIAVSGVCDILGYAAFVEGSRSSLAIASVSASQYAVVAIVGGMLAFRERFTRLQAAGIALTLAGVLTLALAQA